MGASVRSWPRIAVGLLAAGTILAGCGGGGGGGTSEVTAPPVSGPPSQGGNTAPEIKGTPEMATVVGQQYSFQPTATDADRDPITFTISSKPSWAQFDPATGRLWGTPTAADVGVHERIEIAATDGKLTSALPPFAVIVAASQSADVLTIGWTPPTEYDDGTPLTDLAGFRLYYGSASQDYAGTLAIDDPRATSHVVDSLPPGSYYFALTAINVDGTESVYSTEVNATL